MFQIINCLKNLHWRIILPANHVYFVEIFPALFERLIKIGPLDGLFIQIFDVSLLFPFFSSYGQNLSTSTFIGETSFAILVSILGLVLFAHLIGNMQVLLHRY